MYRLLETINDFKSSWQNLQIAWQNTMSTWNDPIKNSFEKEFWSGWEEKLPSIIASMDELQDCLNNALNCTREL